MTQFEFLSLLVSALALVFQAISTLHPFTKKKHTTSTNKQTMEESNREQEA